MNNLVKKAYKLLDTIYEVRNDELNCWGFVKADLSIVPPTHGICYGGFQAPSNTVYFCDNPMPFYYSEKEEKVLKAYINWIVNESCWSPCFITKDPEFIAEKGFIIDASYPAKYCFQAAIALRYFKDKHQERFKLHPLIPISWFTLKDYFEEHLAFVLAHRFRVEKDIFKRMNISDVHTMILFESDNWAPLTWTGLKNMIADKEPKGEPLAGSYLKQNLCDTWGKGKAINVFNPQNEYKIKDDFGEEYSIPGNKLENIQQIVKDWLIKNKQKELVDVSIKK